MDVLFLFTLSWPQYSGQKIRDPFPLQTDRWCRLNYTCHPQTAPPPPVPPSAIYSRHWPPLTFFPQWMAPEVTRSDSLLQPTAEDFWGKYQFRSSKWVLYSRCGVTVFSITPLLLLSPHICIDVNIWGGENSGVMSNCSCTTFDLKGTNGA